MSEEIVIREARASDREQILAFTQDTFHWGDYLSYAWDDWLGSPHGKLLVAEAAGRAIGNLHVAFVGEREAWFEGMRVHPDYRKLGVAARLDMRGRQVARAAGCREARLETALDNYAAQAAIERFGYRRVFALGDWGAPARTGILEHVRQARSRDLAACLALWNHSLMRRSLHSLMPLWNAWHWASLTSRRLRKAISEGHVWVTAQRGRIDGFAKVSGDEDDFQIMMLVGAGKVSTRLLASMRCVAKMVGRRRCYLTAPVTSRFIANAASAGFKRLQGGALIYEQAI